MATNMTMRGNGRRAYGGSGLRTARYLLLGFGFVLGAVLIANGSTLIGVLIAGYAAARLGFLLVLRRRHRQAFTHTTATAPTRQVLRPYARSGFVAAATTIGVSPAELRAGFDGGSSISDLAATRGVAAAGVVEAIVRSVTVDLDAAAANGSVSAQQEAQAKDLLPSWAARLVVAHKGDFERLRG
jgi:hypothetical protein